jgi:hypothetical protein
MARLFDCQVIWVHPDFLFRPPPGWQVDLDRIGPDARKFALEHEDDDMQSPIVYQGVIVRSLKPYPQRVWVLTGEINKRGRFEAKWPD